MSRRPKVQVSDGRDLPGVLRVEIEVQEVERLIRRCREGLARGRGHAVDELRQRRVGHGGNGTLAEVVIIQAEDADVGAEPQLVRAVAPGEIVVDEEARSAPSLQPGVVEASDGGEGGVGADALQHDGESGQRLLKVAGREEAFVPGERRVEVVHQVLREHVRVACCEGIKRLRRDGVEQRIDGVGVGSLQSGVGLKAEPRRVIGADVVVDTGGLHLFVIVAGMRNSFTIGATVAVRRAA